MLGSSELGTRDSGTCFSTINLNLAHDICSLGLTDKKQIVNGMFQTWHVLESVRWSQQDRLDNNCARVIQGFAGEEFIRSSTPWHIGTPRSCWTSSNNEIASYEWNNITMANARYSEILTRIRHSLPLRTNKEFCQMDTLDCSSHPVPFLINLLP